MAMNFPFPLQTELTAIALAYKNSAYIADLVLPRVPVGTRSFKWLQFTRDEMFSIPQTQVGRKGMPTEVQFSGTESSSFVNDYGLDDIIPMEDLENAPPGYNPEGRAVEGIAELIMLDREKRVADLLFTLGTYPAANRTTLSGTGQWSDTTSDPYSAIMTAVDGMLMRPNTMVIGRQVWSKLRVHPKITAALAPSSVGNTPNSSANGAPANTQAVAQLLELDNIYVGDAWYNSAKPGQTSSLTRLWGKNAALIHQNPAASARGNIITFGFTAQWGSRVAGRIEEPRIGLRGGNRVRAGESVRELVTASDVGYFFQNAVA